MYNIEIAPAVGKFLERLHAKEARIVERIERAIDSLKEAPFLGKKLMGELSHYRSLRVGEYRILYTIIEKQILIRIVKIAHRREVYR